MWNLMDNKQTKWDYVGMGNYKMINYCIIAYLQSFSMNVKKN